MRETPHSSTKPKIIPVEHHSETLWKTNNITTGNSVLLHLQQQILNNTAWLTAKTTLRGLTGSVTNRVRTMPPQINIGRSWPIDTVVGAVSIPILTTRTWWSFFDADAQSMVTCYPADGGVFAHCRKQLSLKAAGL